MLFCCHVENKPAKAYVFSLQAFTMPEYLKKRFGGRRIRTYMSALALIMYILRNLCVSLK